MLLRITTEELVLAIEIRIMRLDTMDDGLLLERAETSLET